MKRGEGPNALIEEQAARLGLSCKRLKGGADCLAEHNGHCEAKREADNQQDGRNRESVRGKQPSGVTELCK